MSCRRISRGYIGITEKEIDATIQGLQFIESVF